MSLCEPCNDYSPAEYACVKAMNRLHASLTTPKAEAGPAPGPTQEELLAEIRDLLKARTTPL